MFERKRFARVKNNGYEWVCFYNVSCISFIERVMINDRKTLQI